ALSNPQQGDFTATISWGDGSPSDTGNVFATGGGGFDVQGTHTYAEEGTNLTFSVSVKDSINITGQASTNTFTVADAALTSGTVTVGGGVEGVTPATLSATFTDANLGAPASDFSGTIDWGDGGPTTSFTSADVTSNGGGSFTVSG